MSILNDNPFYLLEASPKDTRATIISKAEEKVFFFENGVCENAQVILLNPIKRIQAELDWFLDVESELISTINTCIADNVEICINELSPLSKLNALLYNFSIAENIESYDVEYTIVHIDEQWALIDANCIIEMINSYRMQAGIPEATKNDVSKALNSKRESIGHLFSKKLQDMSDEAYVSLMTDLAKKYVAKEEFNYGVVIFDVLDQYEVRMQQSIEEYSNALIDQISCIESCTNEETIRENIRKLINQAKDWDLIVQPLQLRSMSSGMPHDNSVEIGNEIRNLILHLHNEKELTDVALELTTTIQPLFIEVDDIFEMLKKDSTDLNDVLKGKTEIDKIIKEIEQFQQQADKMIWMHDYDVEPFWEKIKILNALIQNSNIAQNSKLDLRKTVCSIARNATIKHYNEFPEIAAAISYRTIVRLEQAFYDIPDVYEKLKQDAAPLKEQVLIQKQNFERQMSKSSRPGGCYIATCVYGSYDCPQVWTLRRFRDDLLGSTWYGRTFICIYYWISPTLVKLFGKTNWFKKLWRAILDKMVKKLQGQGFSSTPYVDINWK